ncbi:MAG: phenylalanine--tRNA ligase subunit beta [Dissulfurimicrobium sp.]|uniref:phenylalanine--tRNA ligase subunit beta n=1 Tax=Dissulfurimicrobium sp. TaxID=2022436 RepID=UPI0040490D22
MRILTSWLKEFVPFDIPVERLGQDLTLAGLEIEAIEPFGAGDFVIDISITPNRPDCLSVLGVAREIAAIYGLPLIDSKALDQDESSAPEMLAPIPITIEAPHLCARYTACLIDGVRVGPSPGWLKNRLEACGIRSINNVVDVTNYVLLERGQPLHAFDLNRLKGAAIAVRLAKAGETITTLDGKERFLTPEMLVIADNERPVAIAGVMGGMETEVTGKTSAIILESAWFEPSQVRRTAKALKISTEASYRFERGVDIEGITVALKQAARLISKLSGAAIKWIKDIYPNPFRARVVQIRPERVKRLLGIWIDPARIIKILESLGLRHVQTVAASAEDMEFLIPSYRLDLMEETDLIEEVARLYGYDNIEASIPRAQIITASVDPEISLNGKVKAILAAQGMNEVISYSFISSEEIARLGLDDGDLRLRLVRLQNPLSEDLSVMRTSLIPSLLGAVARNQAHRNMNIRLFEIGTVFYQVNGEGVLPRQEQRVAAVWTGARHQPSWAWGKEKADIFDLKGVMEELLYGLMVRGWFLTPGTPDEPFYLAGTSARVMDLQGRSLGSLGEVAFTVLNSWDIKGPLFAFDLSLEAIGQAISSCVRFRPLPRFPGVERDVAMVVSDRIMVKDIFDFAEINRPLFLEDMDVFDVYTGSPIPKGSKSIGLRLRYRAEDHTLSEEEVSKVNDRFVEALLKRFDGVLRE